MNLQKWLTRREYGYRSQKGDIDFVYSRIYNNMFSFNQWESTYEHGAVFNMEFSPEGNILVAACEKKAVLIFDTVTTKQIHKITDAHTDNVNCVRFLDDHLFATCSDDTTVALWDLRHLKSKVRSLHGHSNWVKNIEYSRKDNLLVTSGFDGCIYTWDIKSHTEQGLIYQRVFHTSGLMRCCISPDGTKLVICTTGGYLMIIHNLSLASLHKDLCGFRPSIFRLMQMGHQYIPQAAKFDHVFSKKQKRNRVELVTDFPEDNDAEVILALQIHPHGHSFLSRNISVDESTEWSCVHDINEEPGDITESFKERKFTRKRKRIFVSGNEQSSAATDGSESNDSSDSVRFNRRRSRYATSTPAVAAAAQPNVTSSPAGSRAATRQESFVPDIWAAEVTVQDRSIRQNRARTSNSMTSYNYVYAISSGVMPVVGGSYGDATTNNASIPDEDNNPNLDSSPTGTGTNAESADVMPIRRIHLDAIISPNRPRHIFQNPKKLMYYIQETNNGKGFIKEPCFSADGRVICSPYKAGVRLLGFDEMCVEYPQRTAAPGTERTVKQLVELKTLSKSHQNIVLCSRFSPREPLLATGCRSGKVAWYHPIF